MTNRPRTAKTYICWLVFTTHGERFPGACLTVGKNCLVVSIKELVNHGRHCFSVHFDLFHILGESIIESERRVTNLDLKVTL